MRRMRWFIVLSWAVVLPGGLAVVGYAGLGIAAYGASGKAPEAQRLSRMERSPQWRDGRFGNALPRVDGPYTEMVREWFLGGSPHRTPSAPVAVAPRIETRVPARPGPGLTVTWFGHSSLLLDIDGHRLLLDPVWSERASPFSFAGPERFFAPPLPLSALPAIDAVLISHDHYDHLDMDTVRALAARDLTWLVPLGIGAHLEFWGVPRERIVELDWWEQHRIGGLMLTATPARHFSGRSVFFMDADRTLWCGWAIAGSAHRVYYSGDTAMFDGFIEIGRRLGPFDVTLMEVGAYDRLWSDVHLGPEQAVRAHRLARGRLLLPVHWGLFDLALHGWTEPIERVLLAAEKEGVEVLAPRPGETLDVGAAAPPLARWWPKLPFRSAAEHDARSTGVDHLLGPELPIAASAPGASGSLP